MDGATDKCLAYEQAFLAHCKLTIAHPYLGCCGPKEGILLLGLFYFNSSRWVTLGFVVGWLGVWYISCATLFVGYGMYPDWGTVGVFDRL